MASLRPVSGSAAEILALLRDWESAPAEPEPLVVATSGSTGQPKRVVLSRRALRASADAAHARLGGPGAWALMLPPAYVAGLMVLFRSVRAGTEPVLDGAAGPDALAALTGPRRYVSLVPTQLVRWTVDAYDVQALAGLDAVLVGGGPLHAADRADAESMGVLVVETYGMSETCGGCVYDGVPLDGVGVKVDAEQRIWLTGPVLFDGYRGDPSGTAEVLQDGWLRTDDLGRLDHDCRLEVFGRADDVVISGGVNVPVSAVRRALEALPEVQQAVVVGVADPEWGQRVVAVVEAPVRVDLARARDAVATRAWAPRALVVVPELPRLTNGKVDRLAVRELAARA